MKEMKNLTLRITIALGLGLVLGLFINLVIFKDGIYDPNNANAIQTFTNDYVVEGILGVIGTMFMRALKMLMVPVVLVSLVLGVSELNDIRQLGRIGARTVILYMLTTAIAITIAIGVGKLIIPTDVVSTADFADYSVASQPPLSEVITNIVPENIAVSIVNTEMLQIIFIAVVFGITIAAVGDKVPTVKKFVKEANTILLKIMVGLMVVFGPIGIFALIAKTFSKISLSEIWALAAFFFAVYITFIIHAIVTYGGITKLLSKLSFVKFVKNAFGTIIFAFSTSSSSATIPVSLETMELKQGVDSKVSSFTIPLGATINMDGTAIMQGCAVVLLAGIAGVDLTLTDYLIVVIMAIFASIGTAGVPGSGMIMLAMVLSQAGINPEYIAYVIGIDRLLDMGRTAVNVLGDQAVSMYVARKENKLNEEVFYNS